jgi:large subunit ribosomal protein L6
MNMSRIGKLPIAIPKGVSVELNESTVNAKGPNGELDCQLPPLVTVTQDGDQLLVTRNSDDQSARAMHGLARTLVNNLVEGVSKGFSKTLEINGVGYTVESKKTKSGDEYLVFNLGYSHPIYYQVPTSVTSTLEGKTKVKLTSADRQALGAAAAKIRSFRPPEPYKGKGVKYSDEFILRKEGKSGGR